MCLKKVPRNGMTKDRGGGGTLGGEDVGEFNFRNGSSSGCHDGLWWLIEDEEDGEVVVGDGVLARDAPSSSSSSPWLTSEWDSEDLTELLERKSDEFVLNHERDKNDTGVILLKSDLTIKV
ncbi:hypothetical protein Tco_0512062 [Tanacetum coccineum]